MDANAVALASLGILGTVVAALVWIIKFLFEKILPILEELRIAIDKNTKQTTANTTYLRARNSRDSDFWQEVRDGLKSIHQSLPGPKQRTVATSASRSKRVIAETEVVRGNAAKSYQARSSKTS